MTSWWMMVLYKCVYYYYETHKLGNVTTTKQEITTYSIINEVTKRIYRLNSLISRQALSQQQKHKTTIDYNKARYYCVFEYQWHRLNHMQTTSTLL